MNETHLWPLRGVYVANVLVAGWVGLTSLLSPAAAYTAVFTGTVSGEDSDLAVRLIGCLWAAIAIVSAAGLVWPTGMAGVLLIQLVYKSLWLIAVALPLVLRGVGAGPAVGNPVANTAASVTRHAVGGFG
ncbi:MAG: hypothetical protein AAF333_10420 [Planctomycetota bacterium]